MRKPMSEQMQEVAKRYKKITGKDFCEKTNADRIRAMSDEDLAEVLCGADFCGCCEYERDNGICHYIDLHPNGKLFDGCVKAALKWLQQPAEEANT